MGSCGSRPQKCIICISLHKIEDHQYGIVGCQKRKGKICIQVTPKCANCMGANVANFSRCTSRYKVKINAKKEKKAKKIQKEKELANNINNKVSEEKRGARL